MKLDIDEDSTRRYLSSEKWPESLQDVLVKGCQSFPLRYFIIDDSGSMAKNDGKKRISVGETSKLVKCSRWSEVTDAIRFHAGLAEAVGIPTEFRLLNGAPPVVLGRGTDDGTAYKALLEYLERSPGGSTPLCHHITEVIEQIRGFEPILRANAQKAVLIIITDGEASDGDVMQALRPLQALPAWMVVRLCTNEIEVTQAWNHVENNLEIELDVLDDLVGEATEIHRVNKWITYGEPLHRLREWGIQLKDMDLLDESHLASEQMRAVCAVVLLGGKVNTLPHPDGAWDSFIQAVNSANITVGTVWDPIKQVDHPWIRVEKLTKAYNSDLAKKKCVVS